MAQPHAQDADWEDDSFLRLYLTTLAGTVIQMQVPVSIHHTWEMLEEYLVEHLPRSSLMDTFGCELTFINAVDYHDTERYSMKFARFLVKSFCICASLR